MHDVGFSGGSQRFSDRYAFRAELFVRGGVISRLKAEKWLRFNLPSNKLPTTNMRSLSIPQDLAEHHRRRLLPRLRHHTTAMLLCGAIPKPTRRLASSMTSTDDVNVAEAKLQHYLAHEG